jgi:HTH-type transcriptional regulator, sugar sensing transcriptional regulator
MELPVILKKFGLNDKEIAVYCALIELGATSVRNISAKTGVNRGTSYDILKALQGHGLVSFYDTKTHQHFVAEPPEKLLLALDERQEELNQVKEEIKESLPELNTLFEKRGGKPVMKIYEGAKGIRQIFEDVLDEVSKSSDKIYYLYSSATSRERKNVYSEMPDFSKKRIAKKINVKIISLGEGGELVGLDERKWMKAESSELKSTHEIIYCGKVAHISLDNEKKPIGVIIQNDAIYQTQKLIFEFNWNKL